MKSSKQESNLQKQAITSPQSTSVQQPFQNYKYAKITGTALQTRIMRKRPFVDKLLNSEQWNLGDRKFRDQNMGMNFKFIAQCFASVLLIDYNKCSLVIKSLTNTAFPNLKKLNLGDNSISSIELLQDVHMPNLVQLHLNDNPITYLKSLRKCNLTKLQLLSIRGTSITGQVWLYDLLILDSPKLTNFLLDYIGQSILKNQNLIWLTKSNWATVYVKQGRYMKRRVMQVKQKKSGKSRQKHNK